jgi:hypothetical protein
MSAPTRRDDRVVERWEAAGASVTGWSALERGGASAPRKPRGPAKRRRLPPPALLLLFGACDATPDGWDSEAGQHTVVPVFFVEDFECDRDGAVVTLPDGLPILMQVYGDVYLDEGFTHWWQYSVVPDFTPGAPMSIPCEDLQDGGRLVYAHE